MDWRNYSWNYSWLNVWMGVLMNANELADELDKSRQEPFTSEYLVGQAATMLRQQQAEIEALKKKAALQRLYDFTQEADNKPYIWMDDLGTTIGNKAYKELDDYLKDGLFPLYTHPAKTLTDEEILKMAADMFHYSEYKLVIDFARAILRKAQEK
jgi:hypothetical protein